MKLNTFFLFTTVAIMPFLVSANGFFSDANPLLSSLNSEEQQNKLAKNAKDFGPQSPRDIDQIVGDNSVVFQMAPASTEMNLCNIHFHKNAEHKGGEFTLYSGDTGQGGYLYAGQLTTAELVPVKTEICADKEGGLLPGNTIEVHYVFSTAKITPGPTLGACFSESSKNPQLRVEAQVYVLVNDSHGADFVELTRFGQTNGRYQALNIPANSGVPVHYAGSTTGPDYNEQGSPYQVSWSVRPQVVKVNIASVGKWCEGNAFDEHHGHGVRNLVTNTRLLSPITK